MIQYKKVEMGFSVLFLTSPQRLKNLLGEIIHTRDYSHVTWKKWDFQAIENIYGNWNRNRTLDKPASIQVIHKVLNKKYLFAT